MIIICQICFGQKLQLLLLVFVENSFAIRAKVWRRPKSQIWIICLPLPLMVASRWPAEATSKIPLTNSTGRAPLNLLDDDDKDAK